MKILLVKPKYIGDVFLLTPNLRLIKQTYPDAEIHLAVRRGTDGIIAGNPDVAKIWYTDSPKGTSGFQKQKAFIQLIRSIRKERYDYVFDLAFGDRSRLLTALSGGDVRVTRLWKLSAPWLFKHFFTHMVDTMTFDLHAVEKDHIQLSKALNFAQPIPHTFSIRKNTPSPVPPENKFLLIHPFSRLKEKEWEMGKWEQFCQYWINKGFHIVVSSGPSSRETSGAQHLQTLAPTKIHATNGTISFQELLFLIDEATAYIGVDTAVSHLSAASKTPSIIFYGPSKLKTWYPWKANGVVITGQGNVIHSENLKLKALSEPVTPDLSKIDLDLVNSTLKQIISYEEIL